MSTKNQNLRIVDEITLHDYIKGTLDPVNRKRVEKLLSLEENRRNLEETKLIFSVAPLDDVVSEKYSPYQGTGSNEVDNSAARRIRLLKERVGASKAAQKGTRRIMDSVEPAAGQIWSVKKEIEGFDKTSLLPLAASPMIYLLTNPETLFFEDSDTQECIDMYKEYSFVEFLPVSLNVEYATNTSIILDGEASPVGLPVAIETSVCSSITLPNLSKCLGELDQESIDKLLNLYAFSIGADYDVELYENTQTGSDTWDKGSDIAEFLEIQSENASILSETVDSVYNNFVINTITLDKPVLELTEAMTGSSVDGTVPSRMPDSETVICDDEKSVLRLEKYSDSGYFLYLAFSGFTGGTDHKLVLRSLKDVSYTRSIDLNPLTFNRFRLPDGLKAGFYEIAIYENGEKLFFTVAKIDLA